MITAPQDTVAWFDSRLVHPAGSGYSKSYSSAGLPQSIGGMSEAGLKLLLPPPPIHQPHSHTNRKPAVARHSVIQYNGMGSNPMYGIPASGYNHSNRSTNPYGLQDTGVRTLFRYHLSFPHTYTIQTGYMALMGHSRVSIQFNFMR